MIDEKWLNKKTTSFEVTLTREMIHRYAKAILEDHAIYYDMNTAKQHGYEDIPAPVTMPIIFWQYVDIPWLKDVDVLIHGEQSFHYEQSLLANQTYQCHIELIALQTKKRKHGRMQIAKHELRILHNDRYYGSSLSTLLILEDH